MPDLALALNNLAALLFKSDDHAGAETTYEEAVKLRRALAKDDGSACDDLANTLASLGLLMAQTGRAARARVLYEEAIAMCSDAALRGHVKAWVANLPPAEDAADAS